MKLTLDDAIRHCEEKSCGNSQCSQEHKQLAKWLKELKKYREYFKENSIEALEKKMEPYYEEMAKLWNEE